MEENHNQCLQQLPKANPIQKRVAVSPRSIMPLLPLPKFHYSQNLIDLAHPFKTKQQQQRLILEQTQLRQLFKKPVYQSHNKFSLQSSNGKFACLKAFYSQSAVYPSPSQPENQQGLVFQSRFQSGNLAMAAESHQSDEYNLLLQKDINSSRCTQWFFFRVHNNKFKGRATFNILNFFKNYSSYENGMKILYCNHKNNYTWSRGCQDIKYRKTNLKISGQKYYYALTFSYQFDTEEDVTYFAHSAPYTFSMLDKLLLNISNSNEYRSICKRKTLAQSPGGNYVDMLTITDFKKQKTKRVVFITSRVHPGESPSSFVCEGLIKYLISDSEDVRQLRQDFIFKIVPMLNPDGVINGSYRCSLSGYDLNRVWHCDNKISSPQIYYTKRAILEQQNLFMYIDLHAHSKKKGVFMYGCQNVNNPFISRHIPYLFWKQIEHFNYYQCNFGMKIGREGTSRLNIHRTLNLMYCYTMEHSFCGPVKEKYHFNVKHYLNIGKNIALTIKKYYTSSKQNEKQVFKQLYQSKELQQIGKQQNSQSSQDSDLDAPPSQFADKIQNKIIKRKASTRFRAKIMEISGDKSKKKDISRRTFYSNQGYRSMQRRNASQNRKRILEFIPQLCSFNVKKQQELLGQQVVLTTRPSQSDRILIPEKQQIAMTARPSERYQFAQMDSLNNLFLPSITSASYKKYGKKKNYPKHFIQVGRQYLESQGFMKQQIRSSSQKKPAGLKDQVLSYL